MIIICGLAAFIFALWGCGVWAYQTCVIEPKDRRNARAVIKTMHQCGLHEALDLCDHCEGEKVSAVGDQVSDLSWIPCKRCQGQGVVKVVRRKDDCPCDLCVGES